MAENSNLNAESQAVQTHVTIMHGMIQRMAGNSSSCKLQCIVSVAAILIGALQTKNSDFILLAFVPLLIFLMLDTYYLSLERGFRISYNEFVESLHKGELQTSVLYNVRPKSSISRDFFRSLRSVAIWALYYPLIIMVMPLWLIGNLY